MCRYNSAISIYKCGAVEHVEKKEEDCKKMHCINSDSHPLNCSGRPFSVMLKHFILYHSLRSPEHGPGCQDIHEKTYSFVNLPSEQCCDKSCKLVQNQEDEGFKNAVKVFQDDVASIVSEMERTERDAASTKQLRDEPM